MLFLALSVVCGVFDLDVFEVSFIPVLRQLVVIILILFPPVLLATTINCNNFRFVLGSISTAVTNNRHNRKKVSV